MRGVRIWDTDGDSVVLTPEVAQVVSSGALSIPSTLNEDDTYGGSVNLLGESGHPEEDIGVAMDTRIYSLSYSFVGHALLTPSGIAYHYMRFMYSPATHYERDEDTGEMTEWAEEANADSFYAQFPEMFWEKKELSSFTAIQLFAAMVFLVFDHSASAYKKIYRIDSINSLDYAIFLKNYGG
jgi:hypothetical protein